MQHLTQQPSLKDTCDSIGYFAVHLSAERESVAEESVACSHCGGGRMSKSDSVSSKNNRRIRERKTKAGREGKREKEGERKREREIKREK